jgi:hypothetical protein
VASGVRGRTSSAVPSYHFDSVVPAEQPCLEFTLAIRAQAPASCLHPLMTLSKHSGCASLCLSTKRGRYRFPAAWNRLSQLIYLTH